MAPHNKAPAGDTRGLLDDYLTEQQLADELDVTIRTLRNWRAAWCGQPTPAKAFR